MVPTTREGRRGARPKLALSRRAWTLASLGPPKWSVGSAALTLLVPLASLVGLLHGAGSADSTPAADESPTDPTSGASVD